MNDLIENIIDETIGFQWYQVLVLFVCVWIFVTTNVNLLFLVIASEAPTHHCITGNGTTAVEIRCPPFDLNTSNCSNLTKVHQFHSIAAEWDIVCDRSRHLQYLNYAQLVGMVIGAPIIGQFADLFGRKWVMYVSLLNTILFGSLCAQSPTWSIFLILRTLLGLFNGGLIAVSYTLLLEYVSKPHRMWITGFVFTVGQGAFVGIAYLTGNWWRLAIVGNIVATPMLIFLLFIEESPRWLLQHGRLKTANKLLESRLQRFRLSDCCSGPGNHSTNNEYAIAGLDFKSLLIHYTHETEHRRRDYSLLWLLEDRKLLRRLLTLWLSWFSCSFITFASFDMIETLAKNIYLNTLIFVGLRLLSAIAVVLLDLIIKACGRRVVHPGSSCLVALACITLAGIDFAGRTEDLSRWCQGLALFVFTVTGPWWFVLYIRTGEITPTAIRAISVGVGFATARFGAIMAPEVIHWANHAPQIIFSVMGALAIVDLGLSAVSLPETKGSPLRAAVVRPRLDPDFDSMSKSPKVTTERSNSFTMYVFNSLERSRLNLRLAQSTPVLQR
jgi:MFS family permease